jgi:hypothetical protein
LLGAAVNYSERHKNTQGGYKRCERLHAFIGKKAIATEKLKAHNCKKQLKKFLFLLQAKVKSNFNSFH